jgi:ubiquilin
LQWFSQIKISVRSPKDRKEYDVNEASTVKQLKERIAVDFSTPVEQQCLIFGGKILNDPERLNEAGVRDSTTLHLVIKSANRDAVLDPDIQPVAIGPAPKIDLAATPFGLGQMGGLAGLSSLGMGSANFMDLQQSLQKEIFRNPALLRTVMDNPLVQQITASPGMVHQLIAANPQMRELMERNPEIEMMLNNSELMTQTLNVARNPTLLREMIRSGERGLGITQPARPPGSGASPVKAPATVADAAGEGSGEKSKSASEAHTGSPFVDPGATSLLQQMMQNPQLMTNTFQSPYFQAMIQHMATNPQLMEQMIALNPMFADPAMHAQMRASLPFISQQMANTDVQAMMTNPRALQAMLQIQEGLQQLHSIAPQLVSRLGIMSPGAVPPVATETGDDPSAPPPPVNPYAQFISGVLKTTATDDPSLPESERYRIQLNQLACMGFIEADRNLQALIATLGNVNAAIAKLLQQQQQSG